MDEKIKIESKTDAPDGGGRPLNIPEKLDGTWLVQYLAPAGIGPHLTAFSYDSDGALIVEYASHHTQGVNLTLRQTATCAGYSGGRLCFRVMCG